MRQLNHPTKTLIVALLSVQMASCGTILYPERRNQKVGHVDAGIAILDAIWLLVGIIPGIIAFAVDFSTGAIYLPNTERASIDGKNMRIVHFDPKTTTPKMVEEIISKETGKDFHFSDKRLKLARLKNTDELPQFFAQAQQ